MQEIAGRHELVEHFALFFEGLMFIGEVAKLELQGRADMLTQFRFQVVTSTTNVGDREAAKIIGESERVSARTVLNELLVDVIRRQRERSSQTRTCQFSLHRSTKP